MLTSIVTIIAKFPLPVFLRAPKPLWKSHWQRMVLQEMWPGVPMRPYLIATGNSQGMTNWPLVTLKSNPRTVRQVEETRGSSHVECKRLTRALAFKCIPPDRSLNWSSQMSDSRALSLRRAFPMTPRVHAILLPGVGRAGLFAPAAIGVRAGSFVANGSPGSARLVAGRPL